MRKRELDALLKLSSRCLVTVGIVWFFFPMSCAGMQRVIVLFPDHTHLLTATGSPATALCNGIMQRLVSMPDKRFYAAGKWFYAAGNYKL